MLVFGFIRIIFQRGEVFYIKMEDIDVKIMDNYVSVL